MLAWKYAGFAVHVFTATGAVCGMFALHAAASNQWADSFLWLGLAAVIDAVDGPVARWIGVEKILPRFSGARLDLVVDYLNYCFVPAFIVLEGGRAGDALGFVAAAAILLSSLYHFADLQSKTRDGFFVGFPAIWNVVVLYFFVFDSPPALTFSVILFLSVMTFVPLKWIHPVRVRHWRVATIVVTLLWSAAALYEVLADFPGLFASRAILAATAAYLLFIGLNRSLTKDRLAVPDR